MQTNLQLLLVTLWLSVLTAWAGSPPLAITTQPVSAVVTMGQPASLSVTNTGTAPCYYQWLKDGAMLPGQTNATLTYAAFQFTNSGSYLVVITNAQGMVISVPASLSVPNAPLKAWGYNNYGQLGNGTTVNTNLPVSVTNNVVAVAAGYEHSLFMKADGTLWAMGYNYYGQLGNGNAVNTNRPVSVASNVVAVAAGYEHSLFVKADGTLWAMGYNNYGQLGNGTTGYNANLPVSVASNVVAVAAGSYHSLFVKADGTLWAMGLNNDGQLGNGTNNNSSRPVSVASNVVAVAAGKLHSLFVKADGTVWAMGYNNYGQLGNGTTVNTNLPVSVASNVVAVAAGCYHSLFVKADGTLWAMGYNGYGQLGNGTTVTTNLPVSVASNVVAVAAGWYHSLFVKADGTLWAMGWNTYGQLGNGTTNNSSLPVSVAGLTVASLGAMDQAYHSLAVAGMAPTGPANQAVGLGRPFTFSLNVTNCDGPFTYQWQFNGTNILDATNASYTVASAAFTDAGTYTATVNGIVGSTTHSASLIVQFIPTITNWPTASTITYGQTLAASTLSGGSASVPGSFAWTTATTVPPLGTASPGVIFTPTDSTNYASVSSSVSLLINLCPVVLTGSRLYDGTVNAAAAILTVANQVTGDTVTVVSGTATLAGALPGARAITDFGSLVLGGSSATKYTLTGATGSVTITPVNTVKPVITTQPASQVVTLGQSVSLSVTDNTDTGGVAYQWFKDGVRLNGQTYSSVSFASFQFTNSGSYQVVMTNTLGMAISVPASLSVSNAPLKAWGFNAYGQLGNGTYVNTSLPASVASNVVAVAAGRYHSLFVKADGTLWAMGYNYFGQLGNGNTTAQHSPVSVAGLTVASLGAMDQASHSLAVAGVAPQITGLNNQAFGLGRPFTFAVTVSNGDGPFTYQWQLNGTNILNATNASYTVASAAFTDAGTYTATVNGVIGSTSQSATLTVNNIGSATVVLSNLNQTYTGSALNATATTTPTNLAVNLTYDGSASAPTNVGSYNVIGTISDANYQGSATNTLVISQAAVTVTPPTLTGGRFATNGNFQFGFTNNQGAAFSVWSSTNLLLPFTNWTLLGTLTNNGSDQYQFSDPAATNVGQRFYRVRSP